MKAFRFSVFSLIFALASVGCKKSEAPEKSSAPVQNSIKHAKGLSIFDYGDYSVVKVSDPWPDATRDYTYVLKEKDAKIPDRDRKSVV